MAQDPDRHRLGNHQTAISLARSVLANPRATPEQKERARSSLMAAEEKARELEEKLGIRKNEA
jgi:hypothetical protein